MTSYRPANQRPARRLVGGRLHCPCHGHARLPGLGQRGRTVAAKPGRAGIIGATLRAIHGSTTPSTVGQRIKPSGREVNGLDTGLGNMGGAGERLAAKLRNPILNYDKTGLPRQDRLDHDKALLIGGNVVEIAV